MEILIKVGFFFALLLLGFIAGRAAEKKHYRSIRKREEELRDLIVIPSRFPPSEPPHYNTDFVCGSVVIGMDYFKMVFGSLMQIFGGAITPYETLIERARRESILRMKEEAKTKNAQYVFNVKFSTASLLNKKGKQAGCVEVIAYGTAIIPK